MNAVVSLTGVVESEFEKPAGGRRRFLVDGVKQIVNELPVQKEPVPMSE